MRHRGRRFTVLGIIFTILVFGALGGILYTYVTQPKEVTVPSIVASQEKYVQAAFPGEIKEIYVEAADRFKAGELLFEIEDETLLRDIQRTSSSIQEKIEDIRRLESPEARWQEELTIRKNIQALENAIALTSVTLENQRRLLDEQQQILDRRENAYERARAAYDQEAVPYSTLLKIEEALFAARSEVEKIRGEIRRLEAENRGRATRLRMEQEALDRVTTVINQGLIEMRQELSAQRAVQEKKFEHLAGLKHRADSAGFVVRRLHQEGEQVAEREPVLLVIPAGQDIWVNAYFQPEDANRLERGDALTVRYQNQTFDAVVARIGVISEPPPWIQPSAFTPDVDYRKVELQFVNPDAAKNAGLVPGIRVDTIFQRPGGLLSRMGLAKPSPPEAGEPAADGPTSPTAAPVPQSSGGSPSTASPTP